MVNLPQVILGSSEHFHVALFEVSSCPAGTRNQGGHQAAFGK